MASVFFLLWHNFLSQLTKDSNFVWNYPFLNITWKAKGSAFIIIPSLFIVYNENFISENLKIQQKNH